jgi:hypothetical protein
VKSGFIFSISLRRVFDGRQANSNLLNKVSILWNKALGTRHSAAANLSVKRVRLPAAGLKYKTEMPQLLNAWCGGKVANFDTGSGNRNNPTKVYKSFRPQAQHGHFNDNIKSSPWSLTRSN